MTCLISDVKIKFSPGTNIMNYADKLHDELIENAFDKWNSIKLSLNQSQIDFIQKEIEKQKNSILTWNKLLDAYIKDDVYGFFDAINILKDGMNKAINNGADELKLIKDTKEIALQFLIVSLL
jgi:hypothetical protein